MTALDVWLLARLAVRRALSVSRQKLCHAKRGTCCPSVPVCGRSQLLLHTYYIVFSMQTGPPTLIEIAQRSLLNALCGGAVPPNLQLGVLPEHICVQLLQGEEVVRAGRMAVGPRQSRSASRSKHKGCHTVF
jgi:hypothetical protein